MSLKKIPEIKPEEGLEERVGLLQGVIFLPFKDTVPVGEEKQVFGYEAKEVTGIHRIRLPYYENILWRLEIGTTIVLKDYPIDFHVEDFRDPLYVLDKGQTIRVWAKNVGTAEQDIWGEVAVKPTTKYKPIPIMRTVPISKKVKLPPKVKVGVPPKRRL